jgi:hypothetical protein
MGLMTNSRRGVVAGTSVLPSVLVVCAVGLHLVAVARGLYVAAPDVTVVHPVKGAAIQGPMEISVVADDGPTGSGVRSVEYQLDSTSGTWLPLSLDSSSKTYKGSWKTQTAGEHRLYVRATDYTGLKRTVLVMVKVAPAPAGSGGGQGAEPVKDEELELSWDAYSWAFDGEGVGTSPRG